MTEWHWTSGGLWYKPGTLTASLTSGRPDYPPQESLELPDHFPGASPFVLWEWERYTVTLDPPIPGIEVWYGDSRADTLGKGIYLLTFENSLGAARIRFEGASIPDLQVEVLSRKLGRPGKPLTQYLSCYRKMVGDICEAFLTLPFKFTAATAHATQGADQPAGPFFTFFFLLHHGEQLTHALQAIQCSPHRILSYEEVEIPIDRVRRLNGAALRWGMSHPDVWQAGGRGWFARDGQVYMPTRLLQELAQETYDVPENRFLKHFTEALENGADEALAAAKAAKLVDGTAIDRVRAVREELREATTWSWLEEVGPMTYLPVASQVLYRKDGYRELFALYPEYLLARVPFGVGLNQAIAARDVATIYEYWCFFRLVRCLADPGGFGPASLILMVDGTGGLAWQAAALFPAVGRRLVFNQTFRGRQESYSLELRPDFTLTGTDGKSELVLDAKFRMQAPPAETVNPALVERSPQQEDIYKMHTYRDALEVRAAVALYPGDRSVFYDQSRQLRRPQITLINLITDGALEGVGAFPMQPWEEGVE